MINITRYITDRQNIITSRFSIIMLCLLIITLSLLNITFLTGTILGIPISTTSALSHQSSTDVSFTFNPILSISLSPDSITTPTIAPGTTATSNTITVNVSTNTAYGYSLLASVGNNTQYNTSDLIHNDNTINSTFTSIATNASLPTLDTDNTWGYSTSLDNGSTWSTYHGLPLYSTVANNTATNNPALLIDTTSPADNKSISFRIAARASSTQPSGTYSNVINFYAVGKPKPPLYMQDVTAIKAKLKNEHDTTTAIDQRDGREYTIAKLKDGKIWMTQNLDLAGSTKLYSETSDVPEGYPQSGNNPYYALPASSTPKRPSDTGAYVYNVPYSQSDRGICASSHPCYSYYSWLAATAWSGRNIASNNTDAPYSICPKGWKLPSSRPTSVADWKAESDFYQLAIAYGMDPRDYHQSTSNFYDQAGSGTVPNFLLAGMHFGSSLAGGGSSGSYWSSTSSSGNIGALYFSFGSSYVYSIESTYRRYGSAVRCIAE